MALFDIVFEGGGAKGSGFVGRSKLSSRRDIPIAGSSARRPERSRRLSSPPATPRASCWPQPRKGFPNGRPRFSSFMDAPSEEDFTQPQRENSLSMELLKRVSLPVPGFSVVQRKLLDALLELPQYRQLFSFIECGGLFSGNKFLEWIREKLAAKGIRPGTKLVDFARQTQQDLSLVVSDTSAMEMLILNHRTAPNCPVEWAVRMSMSIPFVWREVVWKNEWGTYLGKPMAEHFIVDGGVLSNFPIRLIATADDPFIQQVMGNTDPREQATWDSSSTRSCGTGRSQAGSPELKGQIRTVHRLPPGRHDVRGPRQRPDPAAR